MKNGEAIDAFRGEARDLEAIAHGTIWNEIPNVSRTSKFRQQKRTRCELAVAFGPQEL